MFWKQILSAICWEFLKRASSKELESYFQNSGSFLALGLRSGFVNICGNEEENEARCCNYRSQEIALLAINSDYLLVIQVLSPSYCMRIICGLPKYSRRQAHAQKVSWLPSALTFPEVSVVAKVDEQSSLSGAVFPVNEMSLLMINVWHL